MNVLHMNAGDGENSYANNSLLQETVILKAKPITEETIKGLLGMTTTLPTCFKVADLGCSSGPNTLLVISYIIDTVYQICQQEKFKKTPEFQVFLNDLPGNDFNSIFKSLPAFYQRLEQEKGGSLGPCFISGLPGSFYKRLFPSKSLHFLHSSYSVHWLSKVPEGLLNKQNIYMAKTSSSDVFEVYLKQFQKDFFLFLSLRSEEMMSGGRMVLTFVGRSTVDPTTSDCCYPWELLTESLFELVDEGLVEETNIDSFNMPYYNPHEEEVREIVKMEGSFTLDKLETFQTNWDPRDDANNKYFVFNEHEVGKNVANLVRAITEPMLISHFGSVMIDNLFSRYAKHVGQNWLVEKVKGTTIVISLTKF